MNPATRILKITDIITKTRFGENERAAKAWPTILIQSKDGERQLTEPEISRRLVALINQLDQLVHLLEVKSTPSYLYSDAFLKVQKGLSPAKLTQRWADVKKDFSPEAIVTLQWSEWAVGSLEKTVTEDDRQAVQIQIDELQELLEATSLPEPMIRILESQIAALTEALQDYEIYGIEPLEKAIKIVTSDLVTNSEEIIEARKSSPQETNQILSKLNSIMSTTLNTIDRAGKTVGSLKKLWSVGRQMLEHGSDTPLPPMT